MRSVSSRGRALIEQLSGGDRRSLCGARAVADLAAIQPALLPELVRLLVHDDPRIAMRAADALEKATRHQRDALRRHTRFLLGLAGATPHQEARWHLAQMLPAVVNTLPQRRRLRAVLTGYLADRSAIVRTKGADPPRLVDGLLARSYDRLGTPRAWPLAVPEHSCQTSSTTCRLVSPPPGCSRP